MQTNWTTPVLGPVSLPGDPGNAGIQRVGAQEIEKANKTLQEYKAGKSALETRVVTDEQWYKLRHWQEIGSSPNAGDPEPTSAWLLNCINNKHADAMDNYPSPSVLPREQSDEMDAKQLSSILPVVLDRCEFEQTYSDAWWYKLKTGTCVYGVFWSPTANNGLGDVDIRHIDLLNLFWEPGVRDIQKSRNLFHVELAANEVLSAQYPELKGALSSPSLDIKQYVHDDLVVTADKSAVVDWYYKVREGQRDVLHYCKFCNGVVLYASENDPMYAQRGFYDHAQYPFVFDVLFAEEGMPTGFGYVDVCKSPQLYIDKLNQVILKNAVMAARPRYFVRGDGSINQEELADWTKDFVHYLGSGNPKENIMPIEVKPLDGSVLQVMQSKIEELKETSGNRDFSQGGVSSGVTAASAIAALQEAGSKLSRDMIKASYRAFKQVNTLVIELIRQFYDEPRQFRILGPSGAAEYVAYTNANIRPVAQGQDYGLDMGYRRPVFDLQITSQKSSPFSTVAQNERAKELYGMGFFRPDLADQSLAALDMMDFEGIDKVRQRVSQNGTMMQALLQLAQIVDRLTGSTIAQGIMAGTGVQLPGGQTQRAEPEVNALGNEIGRGRTGTAAASRVQAANQARPRV